MITEEQIAQALRLKRKEIAHRYYIKNREEIIKKVTARKMELKQLNLFGGEDEPKESIAHESEYQRWKRVNGYRRRTKGFNEYDMHCGKCSHGYQKSFGESKVRKCELMGDSGGPSSDVSSWCVCKRFEKGIKFEKGFMSSQQMNERRFV
jgi:hypothetical protein